MKDFKLPLLIFGLGVTLLTLTLFSFWLEEVMAPHYPPSDFFENYSNPNPVAPFTERKEI